MISLKYWIDGIVGTCELIASEDTFHRVWVLGDRSITSIHYYDELFEQVIGDLDLERCLPQFEKTLRELGAYDAVVRFATALRDLDRSVEATPSFQDSKKLLASQDWAVFRHAATSVVELPFAKALRRGEELHIGGECAG